jgi:hypothetical protein
MVRCRRQKSVLAVESLARYLDALQKVIRFCYRGSGVNLSEIMTTVWPFWKGIQPSNASKLF